MTKVEINGKKGLNPCLNEMINWTVQKAAAAWNAGVISYDSRTWWL